MFSIAAINDTDSKSQWEPLAPTKEAQEFHLSQTYHEGLLKLQAKEYVKARELLESVLKDPIIANAPVDGCASDEHLLQLRFLALKNLANVFLKQGPEYYESALRCYLQAVEIDSKDSVVWNQLGTLSCSMGLLSISRWAFEQGLLCSPNNWNCMEKLLEVLIAIGDEVACLSIAELILRHWPSHARALHVKITIEESKPVPFSPRGIDKLQPKHVRLKFPEKRKANKEEQDEGVSLKKPNQNIEVILAETSWVALADALLENLLPLTLGNSEQEHKSGDVRLSIRLPISLGNVMDPFQGKESNNKLTNLSHCTDERKTIVKEKEANALEEQPHERRSSRLERLRSRKPGKEESEFTCSKDRAKVVNQYLEHFVGSTMSWTCSDATTCSSNLLDIECGDVSRFVWKNSKNYGAYHMAHMLLEEIARRGVNHRDNSVKFLELEKLTRFWGKDRTTECSLFLAELYYDFGLCAFSMSRKSEFMSEASYHLCKIIESIALSYPFDFSCAMTNRNCSTVQRLQEISGETSCKQTNNVSSLENLLLVSDYGFWIRFFWLSGRLSVFDGSKAKAEEEFGISFWLMEKKQKMDDSASVICLPHCKTVKKLSTDRIMYEINVLKLDMLMENTIGQLIEKEMYIDCAILLAPLLFSAKDVYIDALSFSTQDGMITSTELLALDILIDACQKTKPTNIENYLSAHRRKLQILVAAAQLDDDLVSCKSSHQTQVVNPLTCSDTESKETPSKCSVHLLAEEVKEISQCVSQVKSSIDHSKDYKGLTVPESIISEIQSMLLSVMSNVASILCQKSSDLVISDQSESCCFVDAAIVFCKFQHLDGAIPIKTQVDLIIAMHDLLAEYGLCCAGRGAEGEEGTFLRFAIKHLLALDMKFKTNFYCLNRESIQSEDQISQDSFIKASLSKSVLDAMDDQMDQSKTDRFNSPQKDDSEGLTSKEVSLPKDTLVGCGTVSTKEGSTGCDDIKKDENVTGHLVEDRNGLTDDEREELESKIDSALDQCFFCLYGLNLRSDSSYEEDLVMHRNTSRGDYQTKEQCADVFRYILPYAKASSRTGLVKLRRVLRAIRKHFPQPPEDLLGGNPIDKFLDDPNLCENGLSEEAGSNGFLETITDIMFPNVGGLMQYKTSSLGSSEPYLEVYSNLYYFLALSEEMSATDKWPGFVLTKEGEEFVQQNANLFKYDLLYNPFRFQSWQKLANIYDEEVDLLLNDGSKHINVVAWRKNATLPQRVETSRRRSRRCLLMGLALAKTSAEQCEIHELLALVYYDSIQNVVPFYDQRSVVPSKDAAWMLFCENSMKHFRKAFSHKIDWLYAFYLGKLSQKLGYSHEIALSYYDKAISLNTSAVDAFYRMHASRLKLLYTCGEQNLEVLKVVSAYSFNPNAKEAVMNILGEMAVSPLQAKETINQEVPEVKRQGAFHKLEEAWSMLYSDCLSALETCVEGDLKHYHKARYMLAQGLYRRGKKRDLERAKEELSFCFKSSRSSFTINMWEIDSMVKKGRRKTPGAAGSKRALEVNLPESSRKFITCIRKYVLFYLKLLEETKDTCTLDRAYISLRADKRFSLCIEDLVPVALGRYLKALVSSVHQSLNASSDTPSTSEHVLEKLFALFMEQGNLWPDILGLPEVKRPNMSEISLHGYLHEYMISLEKNGKLEVIEAINEKIRKRFKNPKLSNSNCAKVCRHASLAWCRSLINGLAAITPMHPGESSEGLNSADGTLDNGQLLCVDLETHDLWSTEFEDQIQSKVLQTKWYPFLSKIKNTVIKRASQESLETANNLLKSSFNFYRESSCEILKSGINLYLIPSRLATETHFHQSTDDVEIIDLSIPRKLLLWAYTLQHGQYVNISHVVKHCEDSVKSKIKRGSGTLPVSSGTPSAATSVAGLVRDGANSGVCADLDPAPPRVKAPSASQSGGNASHSANLTVSSCETPKNLFTFPQLHHCNNSGGDGSNSMACEGDPDLC